MENQKNAGDHETDESGDCRANHILPRFTRDQNFTLAAFIDEIANTRDDDDGYDFEQIEKAFDTHYGTDEYLTIFFNCLVPLQSKYMHPQGPPTQKEDGTWLWPEDKSHDTHEALGIYLMDAIYRELSKHIKLPPCSYDGRQPALVSTTNTR